VADFAKRASGDRDTGRGQLIHGLVDLWRKQGDSFEEGIAAALEAILVSPQFLFPDRTRPAGCGGAHDGRIGDYEMASRLSYFLWSSMPDAELLRVAGLGQLRQPAVLTAQVKRMLKDPKSAALVENFGASGCSSRIIDVQKPIPRSFRSSTSICAACAARRSLFFENIHPAGPQHSGLSERVVFVPG
jgi:hypothetical protein